jgi:hypothetical protein
MFSMPYEIASVVSLPRNDITTQSGRQESRKIEAGNLDARLRGHDGKNTPTPQLNVSEFLQLDENTGYFLGHEFLPQSWPQ